MKSNVSLEPRRPGLSRRSSSFLQFTRSLLSGKIVDGRAGGLIFGRTLEEGGILGHLQARL